MSHTLYVFGVLFDVLAACVFGPSHMAFTLPKLLPAITILDFDVCTNIDELFCEYLCVRLSVYEVHTKNESTTETLLVIVCTVYGCIMYVYHLLLAKMNFMIITATFQQYLALRLPN